MGKSTDIQYVGLADLVPKVQEVVKVYRDHVLGAIANCADENAKLVLGELERITVKTAYDTGEYSKSWKIKPMKKAKYVRYIGNTKKVKAHYKDEKATIPLINILEFTENKDKKRPIVGAAISNKKDEVINNIINKIGKVGN